ncbi:hypothetical protein [Pantoea septica]|uniref:hypothetical protein n=1 Tax=Pantoea septica TaxID=472695 RepID=UPI0028A2CDE3|nr:hypothetical protein [Pantoea septica]
MSEAIKEIAGALKDALVTPLQEAFVYRARNPFFGTLVISWFFYNWDKIAFFFLSDMKVLQRIDYIRHKVPDNTVFFGQSIPHAHSVLFPFLWAIFISVTYPFFTYAAIWVHKKTTSQIETINSGKKKARIQLQKDLMVEMAKNESAKAKQIAQEEAEIEVFRENAARSRANIDMLRTQKSTLESEIASLELQQNSAQTTLSASSGELDVVMKKLQSTSFEYQKLLKKHISIEDLIYKNNEQEQEINSLNKKLNQADETAEEFMDIAMQLKDEKERSLKKDGLIKELSSKLTASLQKEVKNFSSSVEITNSMHDLQKEYPNIFVIQPEKMQLEVRDSYKKKLSELNSKSGLGLQRVSSDSYGNILLEGIDMTKKEHELKDVSNLSKNKGRNQ